MDLRVAHEEALDLNRVQVLTAGDDDVLLAVHQIVEAFLVLARHVAGVEPALLDRFLGGLRILVVLLHDARALDAELADLSLRHRIVILVHDLALPAEARDADGADLADVLDAEVHAAGAGGLGETVVRVVLVVREVLQPVPDEARRHRLRADVHEAPLAQAVVLQIQLSGIQRRQDILGPRHQEPDDGAAFIRYGAENDLRRVSLQDDAAASRVEGAEPVHLGTGVVQRRNAEEHVVLLRLMVRGLHAGGLHQRGVVQKDGLREAGGAGREIDGGIVRVLHEHSGRDGGGVRRLAVVILRVGRAGIADKVQKHVVLQLGCDILDAADELGAVEQDVGVRSLQAVVDLLRGKAEIQRHRQGAGLQDPEIDGEPFQTVHEKHCALLASLDPAFQKHVGDTVRFLVKHGPGDLAAVIGGRRRLDQLILLPCDSLIFLELRIDLHQSYLAPVQLAVSLQQICDRHLFFPPSQILFFLL